MKIDSLLNAFVYKYLHKYSHKTLILYKCYACTEQGCRSTIYKISLDLAPCGRQQ